MIRFEDDDDSSELTDDGFEGGYCDFSVVSGFVSEKGMGGGERWNGRWWFVLGLLVA